MQTKKLPLQLKVMVGSNNDKKMVLSGQPASIEAFLAAVAIGSINVMLKIRISDNNKSVPNSQVNKSL